MFKLYTTILLILIFSCVYEHSYSQNYPVYNHFYDNPFIYNPAEAGSAQRAATYFTHRQQWLGVEGGPVLSTFSFHMPFDKKNISLGLNVSSFNRGLLNTTDALITYNYAIPLGNEQFVKFGLSSGIISHSLDLSQVDNLDDPAVLAFMNKNMQLAGKFGLKYQSDGINLGIVLPQLFQQQFNFSSSFEKYDLNPLGEVLIMAYYKKQVADHYRKKSKGRVRKNEEPHFAPLELHFLYRYSQVNENQLEALAKLNVSDNFWIGTSYRQGYGFTANTGYKTNGFTLAYAYEPANKLVSNLLKGSHEIQLSVRFGKIAEPKPPKSKPDIVENVKETDTDNKHRARYQSGESTNVRNNSFKNASGKMHIVSIKQFDNFTEADQYKQYLQKRKINARIYVDQVYNTYHIYLFESEKLGDAKKELKRLKKNRKYKGAKIITF